MRKRIKNFLNEKEEVMDLSQDNNEEKEGYLELLINDLKSESQVMPKYSLWNDLVTKCLFEKDNKN